ncbi:MAG: CopG family transcriptional regulator [Rhizobiales bacterium]|nr:CopG family transcriptional regulator [Hyphomicrobiales bacterium]MBI3674489.1 CopG family transcriptional regulator [Hyphomicrobiales bacterium]
MKTIYRLATTAVLIALPHHAFAAVIKGSMYKNPTCTCCETYAAYLEKNGLKIKIIPTNDLDQIAATEGVPDQLRSCHTIKFGNLVIEGFVPFKQVKKMLTMPFNAKGLSMPGMPMDIAEMGFDSMPGMEKATYTIYAFTTDGKDPTIFGTYSSN